MNINMKKAREAAGLSQKQVALTLKVSAPTVSDWEAGKIKPTADNLKRLSNLYNTSVDYLLELTDAPLKVGGNELFYLNQYIKNRLSGKSFEEFAEEHGIDPRVMELIKDGPGKVKEKYPGNLADLKTCLGADDLRDLAKALDVDFIYLVCLYDGYNPHRVKNVKIPADDMTPIPVCDSSSDTAVVRLLPVDLELFGEAAPTFGTYEPISMLFSLYSITVQQFANLSGLSRSAVERLSIVATPLNGKYGKNPLYDLISVEQYKRINDFFLVDLTKRNSYGECELPFFPNKKVVGKIRALVEHASPSEDINAKLAELERKNQDLDARISAIEGSNTREDIARMEAAAELSASPSVYAGISNPVEHGE